MAYRVLIGDDEENILELLSFQLERAGYETCLARTGTEVIEAFASCHPHLVVLDIMLPELDGFEVCRKIRKESSVPILMLTALHQETDMVLGLELGADDYMTKPCSPRELLARVKAILRRSEGGQLPDSDRLIRGDLIIDLQKYEVLHRNQKVLLTRKEFDLLAYLARHPGLVFERSTLLERIWGDVYLGEDRTIDVHMRHIRQKIEDNPATPRYLVTVRGVGYKFEG